MARIWQCGFELNSITAGVEFSNVTGTATVQTGTVRTGTYAGRTNPAAATGFFRYHAFAANQSTAGCQRAYMRIATLPAANTTVMRFLDIANATCAQLRLTATGTLVLLDAAGTPVGSASAALSTNTWYRIELQCDASTSPGSVAGRVDGVSFASGANSVQSPWARIVIGPVITATCDLLWDDWALNDASGSVQTSFPGDGKILHLVPNGDGDNHAWANTANGAGASTNWQLVDEAPPNDATDLVQTGTLNTEDMYALTDSGIGAGDTVNTVMVGVRLRNNTADATTAAKVQVKKTSAGTIAQGTAIVPNTATFFTNAPAEPRNYTLITTADPDSAAWTQATLDSMQAGAKLTVAGTNRIQVTALWASVDYTPSTSQSIAPGGITSAEAFGAASLSLDIAPAGIASAEAHGQATVGVTVNPAGIGTAEAHGTPALGLEVAPSGISSAEAYGTAGLSLDVAPSGIASGELHGAAILGSTVTPAGISSGEAYGVPALAMAGTIAPSGIPTGETHGTPSITADAVIAPTGTASSEAHGIPLLALTVTPTGIGPGEAHGQPIIGLEVAATGIPTAEAHGLPALGQTITATGIASAEAHGIPALTFGGPPATVPGRGTAALLDRPRPALLDRPRPLMAAYGSEVSLR